MANKTKFNKLTCDKLCTLRRNGLPKNACAKKCRIHPNTLDYWIKKGANAKSGQYKEFYLNWQEADSEYQMYHLDKINKSKDWRASRYLLEVTSPKDYIVQEQVNIEATHQKKKPKTETIYDIVDKELGIL